MKQEELDLWRMVDIGWYSSSRLNFKTALEIIEANVKEGKKDIQASWNIIKNRYTKISTRFEEIDLGSLDDRFSVSVLDELKTDVFPEMGKVYGELDTLLTQYVSGSNPVSESILSKISVSQSLVERMRVLGNEFQQNERYHKYRETNPNRIYLK